MGSGRAREQPRPYYQRWDLQLYCVTHTVHNHSPTAPITHTHYTHYSPTLHLSLTHCTPSLTHTAPSLTHCTPSLTHTAPSLIHYTHHSYTAPITHTHYTHHSHTLHPSLTLYTNICYTCEDVCFHEFLHCCSCPGWNRMLFPVSTEHCWNPSGDMILM